MPPSKSKAQRDLEALISGPAPLPGSRQPRPDWTRAQIRRKAKELIASGKWGQLSQTQKRLYEKGGQFNATRDETLLVQKEFQKRMKGQ
jgi:hypothetical protein